MQYSPQPVDPQQKEEGVMEWEEFMDVGKVSVREKEEEGGRREGGRGGGGKRRRRRSSGRRRGGGRRSWGGGRGKEEGDGKNFREKCEAGERKLSKKKVVIL